MTGEVIPFGQVLPVGGIRDKVLAAHRCGLTRVILPHRNRPRVDEKARRRPPPRARSPLRDRHRRPAGPGATGRADVSGAAPSSRWRPVPASVIETGPLCRSSAAVADGARRGDALTTGVTHACCRAPVRDGQLGQQLRRRGRLDGDTAGLDAQHDVPGPRRVSRRGAARCGACRAEGDLRCPVFQDTFDLAGRVLDGHEADAQRDHHAPVAAGYGVAGGSWRTGQRLPRPYVDPGAVPSASTTPIPHRKSQLRASKEHLGRGRGKHCMVERNSDT